MSAHWCRVRASACVWCLAVLIWCKMSSVSCSYADILIKSIEYFHLSTNVLEKCLSVWCIMHVTLHFYGRLTPFPEITLPYLCASVCMQGLLGRWLPEHFLQLKQINALIYISLWELGYWWCIHLCDCVCVWERDSEHERETNFILHLFCVLFKFSPLEKLAPQFAYNWILLQ